MFCLHCGHRNQEGARHCDRCGFAIGSEPVGRAGKDLVVYRDGVLPARCVKCGEPARPERLRMTYYWHHPFLYLLVFGGCLVYLIVALVVRKRFPLGLPLCAAHFRRRRAEIGVGAILLLATLPAAIAAGHAGYVEVAWVLALSLPLAGLVCLSFAGSILRPTRITDAVAVFRGAGERFLSGLAETGPPPAR